MGKVLFPDYFSFCRVDSYSEIPTFERENYFSGLAENLNALMAAYWRVRYWRVDYYGVDNSDALVRGIGVYGFDVQKEEQLVCPNRFIEFSFATIGSVEPENFQEHLFTIFDNQFFINLGYGANVLNEFAYRLLYLPYSDLTGGAEVFSHYRGNPLVQPDNPFILKIPIADAGILYFPYISDKDRELKGATITITPHQYWSYDGTYDTSTGLPLNT